MSHGPGAPRRAPGDARARVQTAATNAARYLGANSVRGLLLGAAVWFSFLTIADLIFDRSATWTVYAGSVGGYVGGCVVYRSAKRALAAWTAARRDSPP